MDDFLKSSLENHLSSGKPSFISSLIFSIDKNQEIEIKMVNRGSRLTPLIILIFFDIYMFLITLKTALHNKIFITVTYRKLLPTQPFIITRKEKKKKTYKTLKWIIHKFCPTESETWKNKK